jgi:hypothetical protein
MQPRTRGAAAYSLILSLIVLLSASGGVTAVELDSHPSVWITHLGGSICSVKYGHTAFNDGRTSWADVYDTNGNCTYVRAKAYWYHDEIGWYTALGPINGTYSSLSTGGILSWGHHPVCGQTTVWHCVNKP